MSDRIDTTLRLEALTAGEQWRSAVMRQNAAEADAAALRFNMAKVRSRFAPPIETGDGRNRDADLAQLATIEAELLAEIRQQTAAAAASEARALETLAKFEKELGVGGEQVRLGDGTEGQSPQTVSAPAITINGLVDSAMRPSSAHSIADDELWTLHDQCAALRARTLALASSSALACANLNDTIAADQRRAAQTLASLSQFDDLELADPGVPLPVAGTPPQTRSDSRRCSPPTTRPAPNSGSCDIRRHERRAGHARSGVVRKRRDQQRTRVGDRPPSRTTAGGRRRTGTAAGRTHARRRRRSRAAACWRRHRHVWARRYVRSG